MKSQQVLLSRESLLTERITSFEVKEKEIQEKGEKLKVIKENNNYELLLVAFKIKLLSMLGFFSSKNLKDSKSKDLLQNFETKDLQTLHKKFKTGYKYLKLLAFLDSIIEKITERKLKTSRFIHAQI